MNYTKKLFLSFCIPFIFITTIYLYKYFNNENTKEKIASDYTYVCTYVQNGYTKNATFNYTKDNINYLKYEKSFNLDILSTNKDILLKQLKTSKQNIDGDNVESDIVETDKKLTLKVKYTNNKNNNSDSTDVLNKIMLTKLKNSKLKTVQKEMKKYNFQCSMK